MIDTAHFFVELVPMRLGMPYVHIWNILHLDRSGSSPACLFGWPYETTPEALARNVDGLKKFGGLLAPVLAVAKSYAERNGLQIDWNDPAAIGGIVCIHAWKIDRDIAMREQTTQGVVTTHEPSNHDRYGYVFSVNGKNFTGWESPKKEELEIGKRVVVYYDPQNPNKNALTEFRDLGMSALGPVPTMLFGIGAVAWYIGHRRRRNQIDSSHLPVTS